VQTADIFETPDGLHVALKCQVLRKRHRYHRRGQRPQGRRAPGFLQLQKPPTLYTEYNVGHDARSFRLSSKINQNEIGAELIDGVLTLTLPKLAEAKPRTIQVK
jgi:HSP20 family protein